jgi:hypothetical protein
MRVDPIVRLQQAAQQLGITAADLMAASECAACSSVSLPSDRPGGVVLRVEHEPTCAELQRLGPGVFPLTFADRGGDGVLVEIVAVDGSTRPVETVAGRIDSVARHYDIAGGELVSALVCSRCESTLELGTDDRIAFRVVHEQSCRLYPRVAGRQSASVIIDGRPADALGIEHVRPAVES